MAKHIHIHLHRTTDAEPEGKWVTVNGAHVFIEGGKITKGPKEMVGKTEGEARGGHEKPDRELVEERLHEVRAHAEEDPEQGGWTREHMEAMYSTLGKRLAGKGAQGKKRKDDLALHEALRRHLAG